jgi:hypothetical protein
LAANFGMARELNIRSLDSASRVSSAVRRFWVLGSRFFVLVRDHPLDSRAFIPS